MGVFLYYLPNKSASDISRDSLRDSPLADPLRDCLTTAAEFERRIAMRDVLARGPDGGNGVIVCAPGKELHGPQPLGMYAQRQRWVSWNQGAYWIGVDLQDLPTPTDLQRTDLVSGYDVELGETTWHVPTIRRGAKVPNLPHSIGFNSDGIFEMKLRKDWQVIWEQSGLIFDQFFQPGNYPFQSVATLCAVMLGVNYRVANPECSILELFDTTNWSRIYEAVVDWPLVREMTQEDGPGETPGGNVVAPARAEAPGELSVTPGSAA